MSVQQRLSGFLGQAAANRRTAGRWLGKGFWAIMDQGLFAVSNFALNIMLARWLSPEQYGAFAVSYSILLLIGGFHNSFFTEPMLVFGSGKYAPHFSSYLALLYRRQWQGLIILGVLLGACAALIWGLGAVEAARSLLIIAVTSPFILSLWFWRRACYTQGKARTAAAASATYLVLVVGGAILLQSLNAMTTAGAFLVMAIAGFAVSVGLHRVQVAKTGAPMDNPIDNLIYDHWHYGRWALAATLASWIPNNVYYFVLPLWVDLGATGALKALITLTMPISQITAALGVLIVPQLVRVRTETSFGQIVSALTLVFGLAAAGYWLLLSVFRIEAVGLLFGSQYLEIVNLVVLIGLLPILASTSQVLAGALRALERPELVFRGFLASAVAAVAIGWAAIPIAGLAGAAVGLLFLAFVKLLVMLWLLVNERHKSMSS